MANVLDVAFLLAFGAWAYLVAKRKRRDEVGWAICAAVAFFLPGYAMQEAIFPALAKAYGWPDAWQKPAGFIAGGACALVLNLVLTLVVRPLPAAEDREGEGPGGPGGAGGPPEPREGAPEAEARGAEPPAAPDDQPPAQQMAAAPARAPAAATADPLAILRRYWPAVVIVLMYLVTQFDPVTEWLREVGTEVHATARPFLANGAPASQDTELNALDSTTAPYARGDAILIQGTASNGSKVEAAFTYGAARDGTTLGALCETISEAFGQAACSIDPTGRLVLAADSPGAARLSLELTDGEATAGAASWREHAFAETRPGRNGLEPPYLPVREVLLPFLVAAQVWLVSRHLLASVLSGLLVALFIPTINWMEWRWSRGSSYYSHGYLIPFVVVWLVWLKRKRLAALRPSEDLRHLGLLVLGGGVLLHVAGTFIRAYSVQGVSLVVVLCGAVCFLCGKALSRALLFPVAFTIAMIPLPMHAIERLTFKLKTFASTASVWVVDALRAVGLHTYVLVRVGSYVYWDTPEGTTDHIIVGDVCSGLRSLIALLAFGALFAYLAKLSLARKLALFAAAVPISILANMWRIVTLTFIGCRWGSEATHGFVHDVTGYGIFAVAFVLFFGFERFLRMFEPAGAEAAPAA